MPNVRWSDLAAEAAAALSPRIRAEIDRRLRLLQSFPEMWPVVQTGPYRGCRRFVAGGQLHVYYRVFPGSLDCFIVALKPARSRSE